MARLYLDNDVSLRLVPGLRVEGHDVTSARDSGLSHATDDQQLLSAVRDGRTLITYNRRDFILLHDAWQTWAPAFGIELPPHPGLLVLDHAPTVAQFEAIVDILDAVHDSLRANQLYWWHRGDGWRRRVLEVGWVPYPSDRPH